MTTDTKRFSLLPLSRRVRAFAALTAAALAIAAITAGFALAQSRSNPIGTGVVVINTTLGYQSGAAAGTGMVLSSSGEILTNNHVIRGATTIKVVVPGTGRSYLAKVVGYDVTNDVAVLQAAGASNLKPIALGTSATLTVGQLVKAVGNAGGTGTLVKTIGQITGLSQTITVNEDTGGTATLRNLIETSATLQPGDSGGPLFSSAGKVIGMDSAAAGSGSVRDISTSDGYAIPISRALAIAGQIASGKASATVHIGATGFLGVSVAQGNNGNAHQAVIAAVVPGSPAASARLEPGDVITAINGTKVSSSAAMTRIIVSKKPGSTITVGYVDTIGTDRTARIKLASGPPQ
jgi:S1-C subfamily serine protease